MASKLKAVAPKAAEPSKPKALIFGKPGAGKTWTSLDFPRCYYVDTEGGANLSHYTDKLAAANGMYLGPEQGSNDFTVVLDQIQALATEEHPYKTLVIDSVSHLFATEVAKTQEKMDSAGEKDEYGASNRPATRQMRRIVNWLDRLDMNVILIAHEKDEYGMKDGQRQVIGQTFDCWAKLEYILHLALRIEKVTPVLRLARVRKTRLLGFPDSSQFPWAYSEFADRYGREIIEGDVKRFNVATAEQIEELNRLLKVVKMDDGWLEGCLRKGKAEQIEDMQSDHVVAMIKLVKERMTQ